MPRFLPDTNCMIAAMCAWHEHHERAFREVGQRLSDGDLMVIAAPTIIETYSVLTRIPPPHRLSAQEALALLEANYLTADRELVALTDIRA
jgi:predicted nucleic acid-binding protein